MLQKIQMRRAFRCFLMAVALLFSSIPGGVAADEAAKDYATLRRQMVDVEIEAAGVTHPGVLESMRTTPRHEFVPAGYRKYAYQDAAMPIGDRQTISPPFVVAYMTEQLDPQKTDRVLEIGTGSGYQAAVLSPLVSEVYTIEIVDRLGRRAERTLKRLGYDNVRVRVGDGYQGWPEHAPFDKIIVTCSPENVPKPLVEQLKEGGQMIVPVGERYQQNLYRLTKTDGRLQREALRATLFVPMTGKAEDARAVQPDPANPQIVNGSFEQVLPSGKQPSGWHYLRQAEVVSEEQGTHDGKRFLRFTNEQPGLACRALQGLALDGRKVPQIEVTLMVRGRDVKNGPDRNQWPGAVITFYDRRRAAIESQWIGYWQGSFDWKIVRKPIDVPLATREAIVRLGLLGGTGTYDVDALGLSAKAQSGPEDP